MTILGVAVGVFVVVALSSVVRGVNESFARDVAAAGPTSFFVYRRPVSGIQSCDPSDPNSCPDRRNPAITNEEAIGIGQLASIYAVTQHVGGNGTFKYRDRSLTAGIEFYGQLDGRGRRRHLPGSQLYRVRIHGAASVVIA